MRFSLFITLASLALTHAGIYKDIDDLWSFDLAEGRNADWMADLYDHVKLPDLTIPGTHGSMTDRLQSSRMQTQSEPLAQQLTGGIRYIDISCRYINNDMRVYHGLADTGYSLQDVLTTLFDFLHDHPREAIILRIQKGSFFDSTKTFLSSIEAHLISGSELSNRANQYIYSTDSKRKVIPTLGQVRGKVLLLRDFKISQAGSYGISWNSDAISSYNHRLALGDPFLGLKWGSIKSNINRSRCKDYKKLRITHTSAGVKPINIATTAVALYGINRRLGRYLMYERGNCFGIVVMDFPGCYLVEHIVRMNKKYLDPERSGIRAEVAEANEVIEGDEVVEADELDDEGPLDQVSDDDSSDDEDGPAPVMM
ncbi:1-phosphatidylinositol phosphodiesterase [Ceratocystis lukuohia]|uniref:1-phosphatidylinositol phosphodiesterase n=1 Tax=Ceratocystis lukuohia TaxID=2019550 RepID=A0ABR4MA53_9PEZI